MLRALFKKKQAETQITSKKSPSTHLSCGQEATNNDNKPTTPITMTMTAMTMTTTMAMTMTMTAMTMTMTMTAMTMTMTIQKK